MNSGWECYVDAWMNYAEAGGRTSRRAYWYFVLFNFLALLVIELLEGILGSLGDILHKLYLVAVLVPNVCIIIRRLHDTGRGWGLVFLAFIPLANLYLFYLMLLKGDDFTNMYGPATDDTSFPGDAPDRNKYRKTSGNVYEYIEPEKQAEPEENTTVHQIKRCEYCGMPLTGASKYCTNCGAKASE